VAIPAAGLLLLVGVVGAVRGRHWGGPLAVVAGTATVAMTALSTTLGWPSLTAGIKDLITDHYTEPTPPDLYSRYLHDEIHFWQSFAQQISSGSLLVAMAALGVIGIVKGLRGGSWPFLAIAAVGVVSLVVHPGDWTRMLAPLWIVAALGLPFLGMRTGGADGVGGSRVPAPAIRRRVGPSRNRISIG
jgi:hypothetical protein